MKNKEANTLKTLNRQEHIWF